MSQSGINCTWPLAGCPLLERDAGPCGRRCQIGPSMMYDPNSVRYFCFLGRPLLGLNLVRYGFFTGPTHYRVMDSLFGLDILGLFNPGIGPPGQYPNSTTRT
ncbi:unnamed protein product [Cuscuta europaea]|uniref:Uncharacterized protein n=1 Tax=Cuscuta europaea TaxID=41803 RepID=A0A9P0YVJ9_CUSEU|nr:unnamed protein product [Cuscuta europaea]